MTKRICLSIVFTCVSFVTFAAHAQTQPQIQRNPQITQPVPVAIREARITKTGPISLVTTNGVLAPLDGKYVNADRVEITIADGRITELRRPTSSAKDAAMEKNEVRNIIVDTNSKVTLEAILIGMRPGDKPANPSVSPGKTRRIQLPPGRYTSAERAVLVVSPGGQIQGIICPTPCRSVE
jgi:hypothetical protein